MFKFFLLATVGVYGSQVAFGPGTGFRNLNIRSYWPKYVRFDSIADDNTHQVGADGMAGAVLYFWGFASGMYLPCAAFFLFDLSYYGPQIVGAPAAAAIAALTML